MNSSSLLLDLFFEKSLLASLRTSVFDWPLFWRNNSDHSLSLLLQLQECKTALYMTLWLEKLYLTEQASASSNAIYNNSKSAEKSTSDKGKQDIWEKRQLKLTRKLKGLLLNSLRTVQFVFDATAHAEDDAEEEE